MSEKIAFQQVNAFVSMTQIQYTLITSGKAYENSEFYYTALGLLRTFPKDLIQLQHAADYFEFCFQVVIRKGIDLFTLPNNLFNGPIQQNKEIFMSLSKGFNNDLVKVFLIDAAIDNHEQIAQMINDIRFSYFVMVGRPTESDLHYYDASRCFGDAHEFIQILEKDLPSINEALPDDYNLKIETFNFAINPQADEYNKNYPAHLSHNNYFILNQILANYWQRKPEEFTKPDIPLFSQQRVSIQLQQCWVIDSLAAHLWDAQPATPIEAKMPPLIVVAPFHFPRHEKLLARSLTDKMEKMWFRLFRTEQQLDYTYIVDNDIAEKLKPEEVATVLKQIAQRLIRLDHVAYLHAQLNYSPVIRLPLVGKSLNMDLSHFKKAFPNKKSAINKIGIIGETMRTKMVAEPFKDFIKARNGQIVFISDLPMEWLKLGNYPICLTHDVCRIPDFNFTGLLNNFIKNQRLTFTIRPDILKRTLIIHCASDEDGSMQQLFKVFDDMHAKLGYINIRCTSVAEISEAVSTHRPDLLILDCHGSFNEKDLSSYLIIDQKRKVFLTGEDIIQHRISAPLVFISACSTMPNYGYVKFISDAFFQAGAFSVTATFLPIDMRDALVLILRLLTNLKPLNAKVVFSNWLAFISHILRSVLVHETVRKVREKYNLQEHIDDNKIAEILGELMMFHKRESAFDNLREYLQSINPAIKLVFDDLDHEWLSYTTIGRADLIYFENWVQQHQKIWFEETNEV
jgi:hypothetical protein